MKNNPFLSVVIVTKNRHCCLKKCLDLVLNQTYSPFEIIIVDSSSGDESKEISKRIKKIKYVRYFNGRNIAISRNLGILMSEGDIIAFLDDDSYVYDNWAREIVKGYINKNIGGTGGRIIEKNNNLYTNNPEKVGGISPQGMLYGYFDYEGESLMEVQWIMGANMSFCKEALIKVGGFDHNFKVGNDIEMSLRITENGYRLMFNPKAMIFHAKARRTILLRIDDNMNLKSFFIYKKNLFFMFIKNRGLKLAFIKTFVYWEILSYWKYFSSEKSCIRIAFILIEISAKIAAFIHYLRIKIFGKINFLEKANMIKLKCS